MRAPAASISAGDRRALGLDHSREQRLLVGEVVVERAARDARGFDELGRAGGRVAFLREESAGG